MDDRMTYLERDLSQLKAEYAGHVVTQTALAESVRGLVIAVDELTATLNKGKGALAAMVSVSGAAGLAVGWLTYHLGAK